MSEHYQTPCGDVVSQITIPAASGKGIRLSQVTQHDGRHFCVCEVREPDPHLARYDTAVGKYVLDLPKIAPCDDDKPICLGCKFLENGVCRREDGPLYQQQVSNESTCDDHVAANICMNCARWVTIPEWNGMGNCDHEESPNYDKDTGPLDTCDHFDYDF